MLAPDLAHRMMKPAWATAQPGLQCKILSRMDDQIYYINYF